jgi:hypothetical protein
MFTLSNSGSLRSTRYALGAVVGALLVAFSASADRAQAQSAGQPQISANDLVKRAVDKELQEAGHDLHFMYRLHKKTPERTETRECLETDAGTLSRVLAINETPLTAEQQQAEAQRLEKYLSEPDKWTRRQKTQKEDSDRVRKMVAALPQAFNYSYAGEDTSPDGRAVVRLTFQPNPNWVPPTRELRVYTGMQGIMWIDKATTRLVRMDAKLFRDVEFGWGILGKLYKGGSFEIEQQPIGNDRWETTRTVLDFDGKALMVKSIHIKVTETLGDFRRAPDKLTLAEGIKMLEQYDPRQDTVAEQTRHQAGSASPPR